MHHVILAHVFVRQLELWVSAVLARAAIAATITRCMASHCTGNSKGSRSDYESGLVFVHQPGCTSLTTSVDETESVVKPTVPSAYRCAEVMLWIVRIPGYACPFHSATNS